MLSTKLRSLSAIGAAATLALSLSACANSSDSAGAGGKKDASAAVQNLTAQQVETAIKNTKVDGKKLNKVVSFKSGDPQLEAAEKQAENLKSTKDLIEPQKCYKLIENSIPHGMEYIVQAQDAPALLVQVVKVKDTNIEDNIDTTLSLSDDCAKITYKSDKHKTTLRNTYKKIDVENANKAIWEINETTRDGQSQSTVMARGANGSMVAVVAGNDADQKDTIIASLKDLLNNLAKQAK
ncbi:hypothetical protein HMPREF3163_05245 [Actinomyces sp. HMSC08A01]|nr:hypothetical protein HMPREF3163_05245 [Actinomyces sp. HMSC08A01]